MQPAKDRLLTIEDVHGNTEPLIGFKNLKSVRKFNGERSISFTVVPTKENVHTVPLVQEESKVQFDDEVYVIKQVIERKVGNRYVKQCEAIHSFFVDFMGAYEYKAYSGKFELWQILNILFEGTGHKYRGESLHDPEGGGKVLYESKELKDFGNDNKLSLFYKALELWGAYFEYVRDFLGYKGMLVTGNPGKDRGFQLRYNYNIKAIVFFASK
ncbi:prophage endopeptidase tail family protein, partial [Bacillus thuringiensis]